MRHRALIIAAAMVGVPQIGAAQTESPASPRVTIRLHAGPNLNLMRDWRDGLSALQSETELRGLRTVDDQSCLCMSWGATGLVHLTPRVGVGVTFEMLRDTRKFSVHEELGHFAGSGDFSFREETIARATQGVIAFYPWSTSRLHLQAGAGTGHGRIDFSSPGGNAKGRGSGLLLSGSIGIEEKFWYIDAGWRFHRERMEYDAATDHAIGMLRDVFEDAAAVQAFVANRESDLTGGWMRLGLSFRFGHPWSTEL